MNIRKTLTVSLLAGAVYFFCIALAHQLQLKIPGLFIYYNVPSEVYQDRIISFAVFGLAVFWLAAWDEVRNGGIRIMRWIFFAGGGSILGLSLVNLLTDFPQYGIEIHIAIFWVETGVLAVYLGWLMILTEKLKKTE